MTGWNSSPSPHTSVRVNSPPGGHSSGIFNSDSSPNPPLERGVQRPAGHDNLNLFSKNNGHTPPPPHTQREHPGDDSQNRLFGPNDKPSIKVRQPPGGSTSANVFGVGISEQDVKPSIKVRQPPGGSTSAHVFGVGSSDDSKTSVKVREAPGGKTSLHVFGVDTSADPTHPPTQQRSTAAKFQSPPSSDFSQQEEHHLIGSHNPNIMSPTEPPPPRHTHHAAPIPPAELKSGNSKTHAAFLANAIDEPLKQKDTHKTFKSSFTDGDDGGDPLKEDTRKPRKLLAPVGGGDTHLPFGPKWGPNDGHQINY